MKINITLVKPRSPRTVRIFTDKDPHFANAHVIRTKTGEVTESHYFLSADIPQFQGIYERDGFIIVKK